MHVSTSQPPSSAPSPARNSASPAHHARRISSSTLAFLSTKTIQDLIDFRDSVEPPTPTRSGISSNAPANVSDELIAISENATLKEAWSLLYTHRIDGIPVWREQNGGRDFVAFLTLLDLAAFSILEPVFDQLASDVEERVAPESSIDFGFAPPMAAKVKEIVAKMVPPQMSKTVADLLNATGLGTPQTQLYGGSPMMQRNLYKFRTTDNLVDLADCMKKGAHKVLAVSPEGPNGKPSTVQILTQTDFLKFLRSHREQIGRPITSVPVHQCLRHTRQRRRSSNASPDDMLDQMDGLPLQRSSTASSMGSDAPSPSRRPPTLLADQKYLYLIPAMSAALAAFQIMHIHRVTGVAVLDLDGVLVANVSASDLRFLNPNDMNDLANQLVGGVTEYVRRVLKESGVDVPASQGRGDVQGLPRPVRVHPTDSVWTAVEMMAEQRMHRVWVVDEEDRPVGVLTATDWLDVLIPG